MFPRLGIGACRGDYQVRTDRGVLGWLTIELPKAPPFLGAEIQKFGDDMT